MCASRKDFILLATGLRTARNVMRAQHSDPVTLAALAQAADYNAETVASACAAMNARFDRSRFLAACGHSAHAK
jgi:hypothetical protein